MKKLICLFCFVGMIILVASCSSEEKTDIENEIKVNCSFFECMEKIDVTNNVEEINDITGIKGELSIDEENYKVYNWHFEEGGIISLKYKIEDNITIPSVETTFIADTISQQGDFSNYTELYHFIENGELVTYQDVVKM